MDQKGNLPQGSVPYRPFVPAEESPTEFTLRAVLLGLIMAIILGAANAYIGLKVGMTVAATFPAATTAFMSATNPTRSR